VTISADLAATIGAAGNLMKAAHDPWWIISSAAVALHGADAGNVGDVDVVLSVSDAQRLLPPLGLELRRGSDHPDFRSDIFGTWTGQPLDIEFMAGFCHRSGDRWSPIQPKTREAIVLGDLAVFVPSRVELLQILRSFGRPKDMERAARLEAVADKV
jgi:hypothetical protein